MPHLPVTGPLLKLHTQLLKSLASLLNIIDRDGDVSKSATGVGVATCVALEGWIGLRTVIVGQLEDTSIRILYLVSVGHA